MRVRRWSDGETTWVEVSPSVGEENGMPAVVVACKGDGREETEQLTREWENARDARRAVSAALRAKQVNLKRGGI